MSAKRLFNKLGFGKMLEAKVIIVKQDIMTNAVNADKFNVHTNNLW
jgi:hypothetical protein